MLNHRGNIRVTNFNTIILPLIVFIGLLICSNSLRNGSELNRKSVPANISILENSAVASPGLRLQVFQKTWILNKDHFNLLAFNSNTISENKNTDIRVYSLQTIRHKIFKVPQFILRYHLFPTEKNEPPLLG
jgi:hypothetical protein